ncbi:DNA repair protein RecO [Lachnospiraceae bacterium LCP25S3_G4]
MNQITVTGMVLSSGPIGEYDRRVVLLTKERGKISAFAKGARRPTSQLMGVTNPFSFGEFIVYEGRNSYTLVQAQISNYFTELRSDVEGAYYGMYFMEIANYYGKEYTDEVAMLKLLYQTLRVLVKKKVPYSLVRYIFELKAITINGEAPQVFQCVACGDTEHPVVFSASKGGVVCQQCDGDVIDGIGLDTSTLYTLQYIISSPIEKLYTFTVKPEVLEKLKQIMKRYMMIYVDKEFKSLEVLELLGMGEAHEY